VLTHTSAATPSGHRRHHANPYHDLLWHEATSLYGHGPDERIFISQLGEDGKDHCRVRRWAHRRAVANGAGERASGLIAKA